MPKKGRQQAEKQAKIHQAAQLKKQERAKKKEYHKNENRKKGRQSQREDALFDLQLEGIGLRVLQSDADGNCMFRSIGDQIEGDQGNHRHYRHVIMNFIDDNREDFEPFMEDDEKFDAYMARMRKDGEWGGHQELYAASRLFQTAFVIHQFNAPMFHINSEASNGRTYHLSYHGEMHYNSVRRMDDEVIPKTPPKQITLQLHQAPSSSSSQNNSNAASLEAERLVSISLPDVSLKHIRLTLMDVDGNPEHAIELLVSGYLPVAGSADDDVDTTGIEVIKSEGNQEIEFDETFSKALDEIANTPPTSTSTTTTSSSSSSSSTKTTTKSKVNKKKNNKTIETEEIVKEVKPIRGGLCPCGSNKKYKKCCMKADQRKQAALKSTDESGDIPQSTIGFGAISI